MYCCGGHYLFECSNRCTSSRKRSRVKRSAFRSLQSIRRHSPPRSVRSDQTGSDVATVGVRGDRSYSIQLPFEGRAPMAISSNSRDSDCDRTNIESFSGFESRVLCTIPTATGRPRRHGYHLPCRHGCHFPRYHGNLLRRYRVTHLPRCHGSRHRGNDLPRRHANGNEATLASHVRNAVLLHRRQQASLIPTRIL